MSSKYTTTNELVNYHKMSSISLMQVVGAFIKPKVWSLVTFVGIPSLALGIWRSDNLLDPHAPPFINNVSQILNLGHCQKCTSPNWHTPCVVVVFGGPVGSGGDALPKSS